MLRLRLLLLWTVLAVLTASGCTNPFGMANTTRAVYTVAYDGNNPTTAGSPVDPNSYVVGAIVTVLPPQPTLAKTNFYFLGWNTQANGLGSSYKPGATFSMGAGNVTLYAQWTASPTYSVTYLINDSSATGSVPVDTKTYLPGDSVTVLDNTGNMTVANKTFAGWQTSGVTYMPGQTFIMGTASVSLAAVWTASPTYKVTYNANFSSTTGSNAGSGTTPIDNNNYLAGTTVNILGNTGNLTNPAAPTFLGWNTKADGSGTMYATGSTFVIGSASVVLYAQWTAATAYRVSYDMNTATGGAPPVDPNSYLTGASVTVASNSGNMVKSGFGFTGWNTKADGSGAFYLPGAVLTMSTSDLILYAQWSPVVYPVSATINFNANLGAGTQPAQIAVVGTVVQLASCVLTRSGYTFTSWNTAPNGSGSNYLNGSAVLMPSGGLALYAQWQVIPTYTITYSGNGATGTAPSDPNSPYTAGSTFTALGNSGNLVKTGYTFAGWNTAANGTGTQYYPSSTYVMGNSSLTLYAVWTTSPTYSVTFQRNGATGGSVPVDSNTYLQGATVSVLGNPNTLVKTGFTFVGWNTNSTATTALTSLTMGTNNVVLYAIWQASTYTITYSGNGATGTVTDPGSPYTYGASVTLLPGSGFTNPGFAFTGWNTAANGAGTPYAAGSILLMPANNVTLYAQWQNSAGGTIVVQAPVQYQVTLQGPTTVSYKTASTYQATLGAGTSTAVWYLNGVALTSSSLPTGVTLDNSQIAGGLSTLTIAWSQLPTSVVWNWGGNLLTCVFTPQTGAITYSGSTSVSVGN